MQVSFPENRAGSCICTGRYRLFIYFNLFTLDSYDHDIHYHENTFLDFRCHVYDSYSSACNSGTTTSKSLQVK
jgi:hypothetical protein